MKLAEAIALGIVALAPTSASSRTMGEMMQHCINATIPEAHSSPYMQGRCIGAVEGIYYIAGSITVCAPSGITLGDLTRHVVIFAANNPHLNNKSFKEVALVALTHKFPCQRT